MEMRTLETVLTQHSFFVGLAPEYIELIAGCGINVRFDPGEYIFREGEPADRFYIIRHGKIGVEIQATDRGTITIETLAEGEVLGWSWLFPPYQWAFDARALEMTRAIALDGVCLRDKCEEDPRFGYDLIKRFSQIMVERLRNTRLQLLNLYSSHTTSP